MLAKTNAFQEKLHMHSLVKLMYDPQKERIFVADSVGTLYIYAAGVIFGRWDYFLIYYMRN